MLLLFLSLLMSVGCSASAQPEAANDTSQDAQESSDMTIGSQAPPIDIEYWLSTGNGKFQPFNKFEPGKVYVLEFWATWCGPCIGSMPHLVETQWKYADQGVTIVSVSDEPLETVESFLATAVRGEEAIETAREVIAASPAEDATSETQAQTAEEQEDDANSGADEGESGEEEPDLPTYGDLTSAYCLTTDPDESVKEEYFLAAGQRGIPCAFIIGKSGVVEWIGHPMAMDDPLAQVVNDSWDREAFGEQFRARQRFEKLMNSAVLAARTGKYDELDELLAELRAFDPDSDLAAQASAMADRLESLALTTMFVNAPERAMEELPKRVKELEGDAEQINSLTWQLVQLEERGQDIEPELLQLAAKLTEEALDDDSPQASLLDTIAHLHYHAGDRDKAIEYQRRAVEQISGDEQRAAIEGFLNKLLVEQEVAEADENGETPDNAENE